MGQKAVAIERVSTRRQTPGLQSPELRARVQAQGYELAKTFTLSLSARKGKQQAVLDEILAGARSGLWSVVLCVALDRVERRGVIALQSWILDLDRAGARLESTSPGEAWLSDKSDELHWSIRLSVEADRAKREAELRAERTARGHARKDELQQGRVKLPLGWKYDKHGKFDSEIVIDEPAMVVVREAFKLAAEGATLQAISRAMRAMGYPRTPLTVGTVLRMPCYSSGVLMVPVAVDVDRAVTPAVQRRAIAALEARRTMTGPRNRNVQATDFAGRIFCYEHLRPLHRQFGPRLKDGSRTRYYRAKGAGGGECGCGIFNADDVDHMVDTLGWMNDEPETEMVALGNSSVRLAQIEQEMTMTFKRKADGWVATLAALEAEQTALKNSDSGGWERRETGRTLGEAWRELDIEGKRRYLERQAETLNWRILVYKGRFADTGEKFVKASVRPFGQEHRDRESRKGMLSHLRTGDQG